MTIVPDPHEPRTPYARGTEGVTRRTQGEDPEIARVEKTTLTLGLLAVGTGVVVVLVALVLGSYIEATPRAMADSAKGHRIAVPAVVAVVVGVVAVVARRRAWALVVSCAAAAAAVVAVLLTVLIPGG